MNAPNAESLLRVWDECHGVHPIYRALALLDAAGLEAGIEDWATAPIGQRDKGLLDLYQTLFGPRLQTVTHCVCCNETLETTFATGDICVQSDVPFSQDKLKFRKQGCSIEYRLPNSEDLLFVLSISNDPAVAQIHLLQRCVIEAKRAGKRQAPEQLPADVVDRLTEEMAKHDPGADVQMQLKCPGCGHVWSVCFDIVSYFWSALEDWAQRTLADVHLLARAYSWSEHDILSLSATRRQHYVEMVRA
jgi:hypothetical protein